MTQFELDSILFSVDDASGRDLQQIPDYTSPPLEDALAATPEAYRSDEVIDAARAAAAAGNCTADGNRCHIPFVPTEFEESKVGVIFHCGALVDPRGYSPLASLLATRYGFPVVVPIFENDLASFGVCDSGRLPLAQAEFENVEKWILAGHSFGGVSVVTDAWARRNDTAVAGLVVIAADVQPNVCGQMDFSSSGLPMAAVSASEDEIVNKTRMELNMVFLSNETLFVDIFGGNHGQFGSYDYSERTPILGQVDGIPLIPAEVQWDLTVSSIYHVASRTGVALALPVETECTKVEGSSAAATTLTWMWAVSLMIIWLCRR